MVTKGSQKITLTDYKAELYNQFKNNYPKIHVIGNPPFGRQASFAIKFIKLCCEFATTISFILPKSFKKTSMQKHFSINYHLIYENDLPDNSFLVNNKDTGTDLSITLKEPMPVTPAVNPLHITEKFIPDNIFKSLDMGESLKIVIFCLIFGIALGNIKSEGQRMLVNILQSIQQASISIFKFLNYFLPFADRKSVV